MQLGRVTFEVVLKMNVQAARDSKPQPGYRALWSRALASSSRDPRAAMTAENGHRLLPVFQRWTVMPLGTLGMP